MGLPGTSVVAAAATYAGLQVRGTLRDLRARLQPWETTAALQQEIALDSAGMALVPKILDEASRASVAEQTLDLARQIMRRLAEAPPVSGTLTADLRDDELLGHDEAAALILGLQDRATRDRAAEWMEGDEAAPALRLWRALARRCVGPYGEHAAAPLTLAGWVAWSTGDELEAREALAMALGAEPGYLFARLLHQACNEGLDPESLRRCLRAERADRERGTGKCAEEASGTPGPEDTDSAAPTDADSTPPTQKADDPSPTPAPLTPPAPSPAHVVDDPHTRDLTRKPRGARVPRPRGAAGTRPGTPGARGAAPATVRTDGTRPSRTSAKDAVRRRGSASSSAPRPRNEGPDGES
jgi:hypothetical protein